LVTRNRPYCPSGTTGTVPRAYDTFRANEGMEGINIKIKKLKMGKVIQNKIQYFKNTILFNKIPL
jgi:hypothetical protein